ncbi:MAG: hypothetical protein WDZ76_11095 [Pseudohongiellaceae bacterium]
MSRENLSRGNNVLTILRSLVCGFCLFGIGSVAETIDGEEFVDPTRPYGYVAEPGGETATDPVQNSLSGNFSVSFIRAGDGGSMAVVNNNRVVVGDMVGGALVIGIERDAVTLLVNEEERRVGLHGTSVKARLEQL